VPTSSDAIRVWSNFAEVSNSLHDEKTAWPRAELLPTPLADVGFGRPIQTGDCQLVAASRPSPCSVPISQGFASSVAAPRLMLPSGSGTEIGATVTVAMPMCCVIPIFRAVDTDRSTMRPTTYGPRSWLVTCAL
jgi:hypothetical protein